jgi:pentatricopeptide repeat protein
METMPQFLGPGKFKELDRLAQMTRDTDTPSQPQLSIPNYKDIILRFEAFDKANKSATPSPSSLSVDDVVSIASLSAPSASSSTPAVLPSLISSSLAIIPDSTALITLDDEPKGNESIVYLANKGNYQKAKHLFNLMKSAHLYVNIEAYTSLLRVAREQGLLVEANQYFQEIMSSPTLLPSVIVWEEKTSLLYKEKNLSELLKSIKHLEKIEVPLSIKPYNQALSLLIKERDRDDDIINFWVEMHEKPIKLDVNSFIPMIQYCSYKGEFEKAFFYYDELKGLAIVPTKEIFIQLLRAAARAPVWVHGYEDSISDVLYELEANEIVPDAVIYNEIIRAYAETGDSLSAEFYFWEMRRKGLPLDKYVYGSLFEAYAKAQSIGAPRYGKKGRFIKPKEFTRSDQEEALRLVGVKKSFTYCKSFFGFSPFSS